MPEVQNPSARLSGISAGSRRHRAAELTGAVCATITATLTTAAFAVSALLIPVADRQGQDGTEWLGRLLFAMVVGLLVVTATALVTLAADAVLLVFGGRRVRAYAGAGGAALLLAVVGLVVWFALAGGPSTTLSDAASPQWWADLLALVLLLTVLPIASAVLSWIAVRHAQAERSGPAPAGSANAGAQASGRASRK